MVTFKQTLQNLSADYKRAALLQGRERGILNALYVLMQPGFVAVFSYRFSHYFYYNKLRVLSRLMNIFEYMYSACEISAQADLGPGLVLEGRLIGMTSVVTTGKNCTFLGHNTLTLAGLENFDPARDRIVLRDYCVLGQSARIIRPVVLESGTQVLPNSLVMMSESNLGATISGIPAKRRRTDDLEAVQTWNPFLSVKINSGETR